jgi:preprotein translocase subunit SecG
MRLFFLNGPRINTNYELTANCIRVGREVDNDINLLVEGVSRYHAIINKSDNGYDILDLNSTNGTKINGSPITAPTPLKISDVITIGDQTIMIQESSGTETTAPAIEGDKKEQDNIAPQQENINPDLSAPSEVTMPIPKMSITPADSENNANPVIAPTENNNQPIIEPIANNNQPVIQPLGNGINNNQPIIEPIANSDQPVIQPLGNGGPATPISFEPISPNNNDSKKVQPSPEPVTPPSDNKSSNENEELGSTSKVDFSMENLFNNSSKKDEKNNDGKSEKNFLLNTLFYIGVIFTAIVLILAFINSEENSQAVVTTQQNTVKPQFLLQYKKEVISKDNVFMYSIQIINNDASITLDDLKYQRHVKTSSELTDKQLASLKYELASTGILELKQPEETATVSEKDNRRFLATSIDNKFNEIKINNTYAPNSFLKVEEIIDDISTTVLGVRSVTLTPAEMKMSAQRAFELAEDKFDNYEADPMNLTIAIKQYKMAIDYLRSFVKKPSYWEIAKKHLELAENILTKKVNAMLYDSDRAFRLSNFEETRVILKDMLKMLEPSDSRYQKARKRLIKLDMLTRGLKEK